MTSRFRSTPSLKAPSFWATRWLRMFPRAARISIRSSKSSSNPNCAARRAAAVATPRPSPGRPDPVAQIRQPVLGPEFIQADTANKGAARRMENPKVKLSPIIPLLSRSQNPFQALFHGIVAMAPGKPDRNFCRGFASGLEEQGHIDGVIAADCERLIRKRGSHLFVVFVVSMMGCNNRCRLARTSRSRDAIHAAPTDENVSATSERSIAPLLLGLTSPLGTAAPTFSHILRARVLCSQAPRLANRCQNCAAGFSLKPPWDRQFGP